MTETEVELVKYVSQMMVMEARRDRGRPEEVAVIALNTIKAYVTCRG